jgi:hypothetical protein
MRTLQSEARRLIRQCTPGDPPVDRLADALLWALYTSGKLMKPRRRRHSKPRRQRAFYGGHYEPRTS